MRVTGSRNPRASRLHLFRERGAAASRQRPLGETSNQTIQRFSCGAIRSGPRAQRPESSIWGALL